MSNWTSAFCDTNHIRIHYTRTGGDKPPFILLHGLMTNGLCWTGLARMLEKDYDVIMPDARGHGQSDVPEHGYRYEDHASDAAGLIAALQLPAPILLGHSMGGLTAAVVASCQPGLLRGVILADPSFLRPEVQREVRDSEVADQHRRMLQRSLAEVMADARSRHPRRAAEAIELFARARLQTSMAAFDVLTPPNPDYTQLVREITAPALLVFGDKGVVTPAVAAALQQLNTGLQVAQIAEAGHSLHMDQPERFAEVVKRFAGTL